MAKKKKKEKKKKKKTPAYTYYSNDNGSLKRNRRTCPKCGAGYFLAEHSDRWTCGHCGYTEFKDKK